MKDFWPQLVELLAGTDAIFAPIRCWEPNSHVCAVLERRELFQRLGLPYRGGGTAAERKEAERIADAIEATGNIAFFRQRGKRTHWRLTDIGDWRMRRLVGSHGVGAMIATMLAVSAHEHRLQTSNGIPEKWLIGLEYEAHDAGRRMARLAETLLPALARGFVESHGDCDGRVGYALTPTGRELLNDFAAGRDAIPDDRDLPDYDQAAGDFYEECLDTACAELRTATPSRENSVAIPLSCGCWPDDAERAAIPPVFTKGGVVRSLGAMKAAVRRTNRTHAVRCRKKVFVSHSKGRK
jgi:hypothetical protein